MFKSMSMNTKLMIPTLLLCMVTGIVGWVGYSSLGLVTLELNNIVDHEYPVVIKADEMFLDFRQIRISLRTLGLPGLSNADADEAVKQTIASIGHYEDSAKELEKKYETFSTEEKATYEKVKTAWANFKQVGGRVLGLQKSGTQEDRKKMVEIFLKDCPEAANAYLSTITDFTNKLKARAADEGDQAEIHAKSASKTILWVIICGLGVGVLAAFFASRYASNLVANISRVAAKLGEGADSVAEVAGGVSQSSQKLASSATEQAAAIQETTAAVEETSAMVAKNADNAKKSSEIASRSQESANKGKASVSDVLKSMEDIAESNDQIAKQSESSNKEMAEVVKLIEEIGSKTKVINDIVFQTKLLSFNASVEAARAGEQGKGFSVVAEEVGNLAQMSGNSAKEITQLLEASTKKVHEMVAASKSKVDRLTADSVEKVRRGIETAKSCEVVLTEIVNGSTEVVTLVSDIDVACNEQSKGVSEINQAIVELATTAEQNSAASGEVASGAEKLNTQVAEIRNLVVDLNSILKGSSSTDRDHSNNFKVDQSNVVTLNPPKAKVATRQPVLKKAVGENYPSNNHPGFEEI